MYTPKKNYIYVYIYIYRVFLMKDIKKIIRLSVFPTAVFINRVTPIVVYRLRFLNLRHTNLWPIPIFPFRFEFISDRFRVFFVRLLPIVLPEELLSIIKFLLKMLVGFRFLLLNVSLIFQQRRITIRTFLSGNRQFGTVRDRQIRR